MFIVERPLHRRLLELPAAWASAFMAHTFTASPRLTGGSSTSPWHRALNVTTKHATATADRRAPYSSFISFRWDNLQKAI